ncbi:MAG: hypothetical protein WC342_01590 [Methanoregula sp.]|jgi:nitrogen regulatory protein PII
MKKIIVILDNRAVELSRQALARLGITGITMIPVREECDDPVVRTADGSEPPVPADPRTSDSRKKMSRRDHTLDSPSGISDEVARPEFRQKTMLVLVVIDEDAGLIVRTLVNTNEDLVHEAGKIYVCPLVSALGIQPDFPETDAPALTRN